MANVKQGTLTRPSEWWKHLRQYAKRRFWKAERASYAKQVKKELQND